MTCKDPYMLREELKHEIEYGVGEGNPGVAAPSTPAAEWQKADTARSLGYGRLLANYLTFDDRSPRNPFGMGSVLSSSQPLTLTEVELDKALDILGAALQEVECNYSGPDC